MNLTLRALDVSAALAHEELLDEAVAESSEALGGPASAPGSARRFLGAAAAREETLVLFAGEEPDRPVAVCVTVPLEDPVSGRSVPLVAALFVTPALRNRGIASALVQEAQRLLTARGLRALAVRASHNDDALISMGERWGFVRRWELMAREG